MINFEILSHSSILGVTAIFTFFQQALNLLIWKYGTIGNLLLDEMHLFLRNRLCIGVVIIC